VKVEFAGQRKIRTRNKVSYRLAHWPIWIAVFFLAPGPLVFDLFEHGIDWRLLLWLSAVIVGTGVAGLRGRLPGVEPAPYIVRFTEDKPNPAYRQICYTFAWSAAINYALFNLTGLVAAVISGKWRLKQMYEYGYFPAFVAVLILGALGFLPRVKSSTRGEGQERRYFYSTVWSVSLAQPILGILWKVAPRTREMDALKLTVFVTILAALGLCARAGLLPRTRPIVPGEQAVSD